MFEAGNKAYNKLEDLPEIIPIFPLDGALLLPSGILPLNIFEPRYLAMVDYVLGSDRLIGMIQPNQSIQNNNQEVPVYKTGCLGRITAFQETEDGRYKINLTGVCRFKIKREIDSVNGFRRVVIDSSAEFDPKQIFVANQINRTLLLNTFKEYLKVNGMDTDWDAIEQTDDNTLVTALCMMSPYGNAEKQALLEAKDLNTRAETLIAITEIALAKQSQESNTIIQ